MLVIISDIHLNDGTCGKSISTGAFELFVDRLRELALQASWRSDGRYEPLREIDLLLMGDILDIQHSTRWLQRADGTSHTIRPWTDFSNPDYASLVSEITRGILQNNSASINVLNKLSGSLLLSLPPADRRGQPVRHPLHHLPVKVNIHYMVGNHDWFYHLPGAGFDALRLEVIAALGLSNDSTPFPHLAEESNRISELLTRHHVYAQHGDLYDTFNFNNTSRGANKRDSAALGDAFAVEIINRFPVEVEKQMGSELPPGLLASLRELVNVRPALAAPLWISSQLRQNNISSVIQLKLKEIWDGLGEEFLSLPFVRSFDKKASLNLVDGLRAVIKITDRFSFATLDSLVVWIRKKFWEEEITFAKHALRENAFLNRKAQFIVYGHTHRHEVVSLDSIPAVPNPTNQLYLNSGTWHTYYDLAIYKPQDQKFVPYQVLTYLAFYGGDECRGRKFDAWSGSFSA
jgi:UDP-2,3-diacylglucosamine pyrophosphatase LpxH